MTVDRNTFLFLSQVYFPDPASVGQHMADAAAELARRGHRVFVLTSRRGYEDPKKRYPARETIDGVEVVRLPLASFGKSSILVRLLGALSFVVQSALCGLMIPRPAAIVVSTSPPMASAAALFLSWVRRVPIKYWVMDLNPDQLIKLELIKATSPIAVMFDYLNRAVLRRASSVIVLDRFMAKRVKHKHPGAETKMHIIPPWPHEDHLREVAHERNPFRDRYGLNGKFVVMYSGNHSPSNPITTVLEASKQFREEEDVVFVFVGGGSEKEKVNALKSANVLSLPYQPLEELSFSLSAADVHVVSVGDPMVGIVHPCKAYGAMAVGKPILLLGPEICHVADMIDQHHVGWRVSHGDVEAAVSLIRRLMKEDPSEAAGIAKRAVDVVRKHLAKDKLCVELCDVIEGTVVRRR